MWLFQVLAGKAKGILGQLASQTKIVIYMNFFIYLKGHCTFIL